MSEQYIGATVCDECGSRFRISQKHKDRVGKPARCPKCKSIFTVQLIDLTPLEEASIQHEDEKEQSEYQERRQRRRTKTEIRQESIDFIRDEFRKLHPRLAEIASGKSSEEDVRLWCYDALVNALGYDPTKEIKTEVKILGQYVDIVL